MTTSDDQVILMDKVRQRIEAWLNGTSLNGFLSSRCQEGYVFDSSRLNCTKLTQPLGDQGQDGVTTLRSDADYHVHAEYFEPIFILFMAVSVVIALIVLRFYVEFLLYMVRRRSTNHHQVRHDQLRAINHLSLRSNFERGSVDSLPPSYGQVAAKMADCPPSYEEASRIYTISNGQCKV
ncbi:hypothetical protein HDE_08661 [Halotydeus destructor]|nr:hypothetical protein HDE_08661 [Halotydeus destructor]